MGTTVSVFPDRPALGNVIHVAIEGVEKKEAIESGTEMFDRYCPALEPPEDQKDKKAYCLVGSWKELKNDAQALQSLDNTLPLSLEKQGGMEYWYGLERSKLLDANLSGTLYVYGKDLKFVSKKEIQFQKNK